MPVTPLYDEKDLLRQLVAGNEMAFQTLYYRYSPRIYGKLLKAVKSEDLAKEVLQETFLAVWKNHAAIDAEQSFRSWCFKIADNLVTDLYRKTTRDKALMEKLLQSAVLHYQHTEEWLLHPRGRVKIW